MSTLAHKLRMCDGASPIEFVGGLLQKNFANPYAFPLTALTGGIGAAALAGDLVIAALAHSNGTAESSQITGYTSLASQGSTYPNLLGARKTMSGPPDTSFQAIFGVVNGTGNRLAGAMVFRGQNATPLDVAVVASSATGNSNANPGSITPVTPGAVIVVIAATGDGSAQPALTSAEFPLFFSDVHSGVGSVPARLAMGARSWNGGAFDAAAFGNGIINASSTWQTLVLAIRPA
jgi:hypothetical protein